MNSVTGFIISSAGKYLDRNFHWHRKSPAEAYVFTQGEVDAILAKARTDGWKRMPESLIPAVYNPETDDTEITGKPAYPGGQ